MLHFCSFSNLYHHLMLYRTFYSKPEVKLYSILWKKLQEKCRKVCDLRAVLIGTALVIVFLKSKRQFGIL